MVEKILTTSNVLLHICDFRVHMQNKYIQLQIYCDFSVRIQILQLQVLKTFATIIPSYPCSAGEKKEDAGSRSGADSQR